MVARQPAFTPDDTYVTFRRSIAHLIDLAVITVPLVIVDELGMALLGEVLSAVLYLLALLGTYTLYFGVLQGAAGWTLGKLLVHIRLVDAAGEPPGVKAGTKRSLTLLIEVFGIIGLIAVLHSLWRQRAGDKWAGTYVTRRLSARR